MSNAATFWAWEHAPVGGSSELLVLIAMARVSDEADQAYPSLAYLAATTRLSRATVKRALLHLEEGRVIEKLEVGGTFGEIRKASLYRLCVDLTPAHHEPTPAHGEQVIDEEEKGSSSMPAHGEQGVHGEQGPDSVGSVWSFYVETMSPRHTTLAAGERKLIIAALKEVSVDECREAIRGCAASAWHMGENPQRRPYNELSRILTAKRPGHHGGVARTLRENVAYFISLAPSADGVPSADPDRVHREKRNVLDAWEFPGNGEAQRRGSESVGWLARHGITTEWDENGRPRFVRTDR